MACGFFSSSPNFSLVLTSLVRFSTNHSTLLQDEINYLSQLRHPNLVRLIGYSFNEDDRILVYEFMARGSLSNHLFTSKSLHTRMTDL